MSGIERLQARAMARQGRTARRALVILTLAGFLALGAAMEMAPSRERLEIDGQPASGSAP